MKGVSAKMPGAASCGNGDIGTHSAAAGYRCDTLVHGIEVYHGASLKKGKVECLHSAKSGLLLGRDETLKRRGHTVVRQKRHHYCHRYAVVGTESRSVGGKIPAVADKRDRIRGKIVIGRAFLFAHHIRVPLKNDRLGAAGLSYNDVVRTVAQTVKSVRTRKLLKIRRDLFLMA